MSIWIWRIKEKKSLKNFRLINTPEEFGEAFDLYLEETTAICVPDPNSADIDSNSLNVGKRKVYNKFPRFLAEKKDNIQTGTVGLT